MDKLEHNLPKNILTLSIFIVVISFVFFQLSTVFTNASMITKEIGVLQAQKQLSLTNLDREMQQLETLKTNVSGETPPSPNELSSESDNLLES